MKLSTLVTCLTVVSVLTACASPRQQARERQAAAAERTLARAGTVGDPGRVAAADFAFARQAREEGQWTAFAATAAPGAMIHGRGGPILAGPWLAEQRDPEQSVAWGPNSVWSSCDGSLAVTFGRFIDPEGLVGSYATVWQLQSDRSYKWTYDMGGPDNPQPPPQEDPDIPEGAIVVPGLTAINGMVADCPGRGHAFADTLEQAQPGIDFGSIRARDGSLEYRWEHGPEGQRRILVGWMREGDWQTALDFIAPLPLED